MDLKQPQIVEVVLKGSDDDGSTSECDTADDERSNQRIHKSSTCISSGVCDSSNNKECDHMNRPMVHVGDVLREAEDIINERTHSPRVKAANGCAEVLVDEVDVQYSPGHSKHPIEVIVRHETVVSQKGGDDYKLNADSESTTMHDCSHPLIASSNVRQQGSSRFYRSTDDTDDDEKAVLAATMLTVDRRQQHREGRCAAEEKASSGKKNDTSSSRTTTSKSVQKFEKGHRRAFSMPSSGGNRMTLSIVNDDQLMDDGLHKRHVVRYKLQPHRHRNANNTLRSSPHNPQQRSVIDMEYSATGVSSAPAVDQDDNELEIEINEEEIVGAATGDEKFGTRTVIKKFWEARWKVTNFEFLPVWLQDNEYLRTGHRPPLPSFVSCFKSIFSLHTETGNIWTHMFGCVAFVGVTLFFLLRPNSLVQWPEKVVFSSFFLGAIVCLGMSFAFHTVQCHSVGVGRLFSKLDYTGITFLIVGSFIPWIYYGFYCRTATMIVYMSMIFMLGIAAVIVSLWDKFAAPKFRPVRAGVFVAMGLSSIVPAIHLFITDGIRVLLDEASLHWLLLMGLLYLTGAAVYASRTPERCFPGKCDLLFQSHQLFHMFVVVAAFVHFHGICEMAMKKLEQGSCAEQVLDRYGIQFQPSSLDNWFGLDSL